MPVAGNNVEVFHLYINGGRLVNLGKHRYPSHLVEGVAVEAVAALMRGRPVYLQAQGTNLGDVKALLHKQGIIV